MTRATAADATAALVQSVLQGDARALSRAMSLVENEAPEAAAILDGVYGRREAPPRVGVTGPPGAGKSTLVAEYAVARRREGLRLGIVAVDPTSPFTGGAILGDRVRMNELSTDPEVFIRSMATRGSLGGLAARTEELCELLGAWGSALTLIETVGVGQSELDVVEAADTTLVTLTPESGDAIQGLKAGLMEIADVFVVNKADHAGADQLTAALRGTLALRPEAPWKPPIVRTVATERKGLDELHEAVLAHRAYISSPERREPRRRAKARARLRTALREGLLGTWWRRRGVERLVDAATLDVIEGRVSPYRAARNLIERMMDHGEPGNDAVPKR